MQAIQRFGGTGGDDLLDVAARLGPGMTGTLNGGAGRDTVLGGTAADFLRGNDGNDLLHGRGGADTLAGGNGDDTLQGERGDLMNGGAGEDRLSLRIGVGSGTGPARVVGGDGFDTLVLHLTAAEITASAKLYVETVHAMLEVAAQSPPPLRESLKRELVRMMVLYAEDLMRRSASRAPAAGP